MGALKTQPAPTVSLPPAAARPRPSALSPHLDCLRAVAALLVVVGHARGLFLVSAPEAGQLGPVAKAVYLLTGFGHQAVLVFFVLSGLLISRKVVDQVSRDTWSWRSYLIQRGTRLLIVLWPALALTYLWDRAGQSLFGTAQIYGGDELGGNVVSTAVTLTSSWVTYLGNAFFLQDIFVPTAGSNTPLWSLSNEFWYYIAFPCLAIALSGGGSRSRRWIAIGTATAVLWMLLYSGKLIGFGIWLMGFAAAGLAAGKTLTGRALPWAWGLSLTAFAAVLLAVRLHSHPSLLFLRENPELGGILVGAATMVVVAVMLRSPSSPHGLYSRSSHLFSSFSYTLYLTHLPFLVFLRAWLVRDSRWQPTPDSLMVLGIICLATTGYAYLVYLLTERHTDSLRRWLSARLPGAAAKAATDATPTSKEKLSA